MPRTPDERSYFLGLGARVADARHGADLTQVQLADGLAITQSQLASYEVGRRRIPVSMLPGIARLTGTTVEALIGEAGDADPKPATPRRTRRGPVSKLEQQLDAIARLPKAEQKIVSTLLDAMLAQHGARSGQEASATA